MDSGSVRSAARMRAGRAGPPARQLLRQPPDAREDLARPDRPALHTGPGRDPDVPGARLSGGETLRRKTDGGAREPAADRERQAGRAAASARGGSRSRAGRAACRRRASSCRSCYRARAARGVEVRDLTFLGRVGWTDVVAEPRARHRRAHVRVIGRPDQPAAHVPRHHAAGRDATSASGRFAVARGSGHARRAARAGRAVTAARAGRQPMRPTARARTASPACSRTPAPDEGVFVLMLLAAFGWGALHALSPGHGKAMVAAYLVGTRGAPRHAVALGGIVTVTHTIGVFALGLVTLLLSQWILPEDLYPWLNLAAGLLIVAVGLSVLGSRVRWAQEHRGPPPSPDAGHHHAHDHEHGHDHSTRPRARPPAHAGSHVAGPRRHGHLRRDHPLPERAGRAARGDLAASRSASGWS